MIQHQQRRAKLLAKIANNSIILIASGAEQIRNRDVEYDFRASSDFFYLTGFTEPDAILVLIKKNAKTKSILFLRPKNELQEIWQGKRLGVSLAPKILAVDKAYDINKFTKKTFKLLENVQNIYFSFTQLNTWQEHISKWLKHQSSKARQGITASNKLIDIDQILHQQRLIKSKFEIDIMRKAAQISVQGHLKALKTAQYEYQIQANVEAAFKQASSPRVAFSSIVASGSNACILHYTQNDQPIKANCLILVDAGAEYQGYAGDITSTFPANGKFSLAQKQLYDLVLQTQQAVIAIIKPNLRYNKLHTCAVQTITKGLLKLGILHGNLADLIKAQAYKKYFMHGTGHWLGMDVHDVGSYKVNNKWRKLKAGMVLTVEPGIYISATVGKKHNINKKYWDIGIRIEDDILVTPTGHEVLSAGLPRTTQAIEAVMEELRIR